MIYVQDNTTKNTTPIETKQLTPTEPLAAQVTFCSLFFVIYTVDSKSALTIGCLRTYCSYWTLTYIIF